MVAGKYQSCQIARRRAASSFHGIRELSTVQEIHFRSQGEITFLKDGEERCQPMSARGRKRGKQCSVRRGANGSASSLAILLFPICRRPARPRKKTRRQIYRRRRRIQYPPHRVPAADRKHQILGENPGYRNQDRVEIQPVRPIGISKDWKLLHDGLRRFQSTSQGRTHGPPRTRGAVRFGEIMQPTFFISPKKTGKES